MTAARATQTSPGLRFGTAGLRAAMGPGADEMNRGTVRRASAGLAAHVTDRHGGAGAPTIVVGHDARHRSAQFARDAAAVFAGAGVRGLLIDGPVPTPVLAYAVRALGGDAGVMVTASHNPATDNGYKVYGADGAQIVAPADAEISARIDAAPAADALALGEPEPADPAIVARYLEAVVPAALAHVPGDRALDIVYTPLHGVGRDAALAAFAGAGFPAVHVVAEQARPDPDFPTVPRPNPEEPGVLDLALRDARARGADIVLANDPDADRLAVAVPWPGAPGGWRTLTGDEVGALLAEQLLRGVGDPTQALLVTTVVSSSQLRALAQAFGARCAETLTGFKWIMQLAATSRQPLLLGYEQALGYAVTELVRDKDGISAALVMAALAAHARARGLTVKDRLDALAERFGLYATAEHSIAFAATGDAARAAAEVDRLCAHPPDALIGEVVTAIDDLATGTRRVPGPAPSTTSLGLPPAGGVVLHAGETVRLAVRPSGTEPKLKLYLQVVEPVDRGGPDAARERAGRRLRALAHETEELIAS